MTQIVIVNASHVLTDDAARAVLPAIQKYDDTLLMPAWSLDRCLYTFQNWAEFQSNPPGPDVWPIFINRHSIEAGVLGFHALDGWKPFGRVFAGDCLLERILWTVDLSHEAAEIRVNPQLNRTWTMPDGRLALMEACDPTESDDQAIDVDGVKLSNFVLKAYFSTAPGPWDVQGRLKGPCPTLTAGGYQSIYDGEWTQVTAMYAGMRPSVRSARWHHGNRLPRVVVP